jgi:hypothetical protein
VDRAISCCSEPQSLATIRLNTGGDREQSPAAEVIAVRARLASLTAAAAQPKARRAQLTAAGKAHELADLERTLSMCVSKPKSISRRGKHRAELHCSSPNTYRRKHSFQVVLSQPTAKQHSRSLRTWRQAVGVGSRAIHRFSRMATDSRSAWLHNSSRVGGSGRVTEVVMDGERRRPSLRCSVATAGRPAGLVSSGSCGCAAASVAMASTCRQGRPESAADGVDVAGRGRRPSTPTRGPETPAGQKGK